MDPIVWSASFKAIWPVTAHCPTETALTTPRFALSDRRETAFDCTERCDMLPDRIIRKSTNNDKLQKFSLGAQIDALQLLCQKKFGSAWTRFHVYEDSATGTNMSALRRSGHRAPSIPHPETHNHPPRPHSLPKTPSALRPLRLPRREHSIPRYSKPSSWRSLLHSAPDINSPSRTSLYATNSKSCNERRGGHGSEPLTAHFWSGFRDPWAIGSTT